VPETFIPTEEELAAGRLLAKDSFVYVPGDNGNWQPLGVVCRANTDCSYREKNVAINKARPIPRFMDRPDLMALRHEPIALVGGGPSVKRHLNDIRKFKWIMAAGSSHDYLIENGIIPTFAVSTDSKEETNLYYQNPVKGCTYLFASSGPPSLFERLKDYDIQLWHFNEQVDPIHYAPERSFGWGCMVGVVCIQVALYLGFQEQHYFGYDCSFERDATHSYAISQEELQGLAEQTTIAYQGEEQVPFLTTTALICQITHFFGVYKCPDGNYLKGYVYGGGMLWDNIRQTPEMRPWLEAVPIRSL